MDPDRLPIPVFSIDLEEGGIWEYQEGDDEIKNIFVIHRTTAHKLLYVQVRRSGPMPGEVENLIITIFNLRARGMEMCNF